MDKNLLSVKTYLENYRGPAISKAQNREMLRMLKVGKRFSTRMITKQEQEEYTILDEYDGDLRLPYKECVFEIPYVSQDEPCILFARQIGASVEVTALLANQQKWLPCRLVGKVSCAKKGPGVNAVILKNMSCRAPLQISRWLANVLLFALNLIHLRPAANNTPAKRPTPHIAYKPPVELPPIIPVHSSTTVFIGPQHSHVGVPQSTGVERRGTPKRLHDRRGHWRLYKKTGKRVWIGPQTVGRRSLGTVTHDYHVA
ncbi:hypothetical protein ACM64Y_14470 [Novispirillum sp. DQ9]|uniref:hypothetical protein n=1 Tax=Novispirillum sp. DQ9 TaxID=3398612 RepID=UPI003C7C821D